MQRCSLNPRSLVTLTLWLLLQVIHPVGAASQADNAWNLPPLVLPDLQGHEHKLYEWHDKVILLNFWASWCAPCQIELPHLISYQQQYQGYGLQVISVGLDEPAKLANVHRTLDIPFPVLTTDPQRGGLQVLKQWGNPLGVLPFTVVIDRDGSIVFRRIGIFDDEAFDRYVRPLLPGDD